MNITPKQAYTIANTVYKSVKEKQTIPEIKNVSRYQLPYLMAKGVLYPNKTIVVNDIKAYTKQEWDYISRDVPRNDYLELAGRLVDYVNKHRQLPSYLTYKNIKISTAVYTYVFASIRVFYELKGRYPSYWNFNNKAFVKPTETTNEVLNLFIKTFGKVTTIDQALGKIQGLGYGFYYDDLLSNAQTIKNLANGGQKPNCTDSSQMMANVGTGLGYTVRGVHVMCNSGVGHIRLQLKHPKHTGGEWINRDPAAVIDGEDVTSIWCSNGEILAYNPDWWLDNLHR